MDTIADYVNYLFIVHKLHDAQHELKLSDFLIIFGDHLYLEMWEEWQENPNILDFFISMGSLDKKKFLIWVLND